MQRMLQQTRRPRLHLISGVSGSCEAARQNTAAQQLAGWPKEGGVTSDLVSWLGSFGSLSMWSGLALAAVFAAAAFVFIPRTFLTVTSGCFFGWVAIPAILLGATLGSALAF